MTLTWNFKLSCHKCNYIHIVRLGVGCRVHKKKILLNHFKKDILLLFQTHPCFQSHVCILFIHTHVPDLSASFFSRCVLFFPDPGASFFSRPICVLFFPDPICVLFFPDPICVLFFPDLSASFFSRCVLFFRNLPASFFSQTYLRPFFSGPTCVLFLQVRPFLPPFFKSEKS